MFGRGYCKKVKDFNIFPSSLNTSLKGIELKKVTLLEDEQAKRGISSSPEIKEKIVVPNTWID